MPKLSHFTKALFNVGMREWRVSKIYLDRGDSTFSLHRIIAPNEREALEIYCLHTTSFDAKEEFDGWFEENEDIHDISKDDPEHEVYDIPSKWDGILVPVIDYPQIYEVDPFTGDQKLLAEYPEGFKWPK